MSVTVENEPTAELEDAALIVRGTFGTGAAAMRVALDCVPDGATFIVDLGHVESMDDRGVGALLSIAYRLGEEGRQLIVRGASPAIVQSLRSVGLQRWAAVM